MSEKFDEFMKALDELCRNHAVCVYENIDGKFVAVDAKGDSVGFHMIDFVDATKGS